MPELTGRFLIDSDVIIDYLKGQNDAVTYLEGLEETPFISAVTMAEIYAGERKGERDAIDAFMTTVEVIDVDREIAVKGGQYRRDYKKSHNLQLPDALIAATAEVWGTTLVTLNKKHFPMLTDVVVPYRKP